MLCLVISSIVLACQQPSTPTVWTVSIRDGAYQVQRYQDKQSVVVYSEPLDISDTYGPNGVIRELWPSRSGTAFGFIRWSERSFDEDGRSEKRLAVYDIRKKRLATVWADRALPTLEQIQATDYFVWSNDKEYRLPVFFMGEVRVSFESILPVGESEGVLMLRTGYQSWNDYFANTKLEVERITHFLPRTGEPLALPDGSVLKIKPNQQGGLTLLKGNDSVLELGEGISVRELQFDSNGWLALSTFRQVSPGSTAAHPITTVLDYRFTSYLINWRTKKVIFKNEAYLIRAVNFEKT